MTRKEELEKYLEQLNSKVQETKKELEFLNSSNIEKILTILSQHERGLIIIELEAQGRIMRLKCKNPNDFSMSFLNLKEIGYCIRSFRRLTENTYNVWFDKIN